ncbi:hypothetical protein QJQ45_001185 [Haematococcus lacustris]|nr:hypothetical protein QJQ45_001185 [Haematococcus lacustris]
MCHCWLPLRAVIASGDPEPTRTTTSHQFTPVKQTIDDQLRPAGPPGASSTPSPAPSLLDLPAALLDDIMSKAAKLGTLYVLLSTSYTLFYRYLLNTPNFRLTLHSKERCERLLTPRIIEALHVRPGGRKLMLLHTHSEAPTGQVVVTSGHEQHMVVLGSVLSKLAGKQTSTSTIHSCELSNKGRPPLEVAPPGRSCLDPPVPLDCTSGLAQLLVASFPSLTALTIHGYSASCRDLASLLSHPQLAQQLQQLDLPRSCIIQEPQQPAQPGEVTLGNLFRGLRLHTLSLEVSSESPLPNLQPLAQHLTQLHIGKPEALMYCLEYVPGNPIGTLTYAASGRPVAPSDYRPEVRERMLTLPSLQPLAQRLAGKSGQPYKVKMLTIVALASLTGLPQLLQYLPQLSLLLLPNTAVKEQAELDMLLAATQLTGIKLKSIEGLTSSCADAPCSWQRLELTGSVSNTTAAYLPLHSLTKPLVLGRLSLRTASDNSTLAAAAVHNLTQACKVPVMIRELELNMRGIPTDISALRTNMQRVSSLLRPLQQGRCLVRDAVSFLNLKDVTAAAVPVLAPLCQRCTGVEFLECSLTPSLEFWHQVMVTMPAVQSIAFRKTEGAGTEAMRESLQLMVEQPWARWLQLGVVHCPSQLAACWQAGGYFQTGGYGVNVIK